MFIGLTLGWARTVNKLTFYDSPRDLSFTEYRPTSKTPIKHVRFAFWGTLRNNYG